MKVLCLHIAGVPAEIPQGEQTLALLEGTHVSFTLLVKATTARNILKKCLFFKDTVQFIFKMYVISKPKASGSLYSGDLHWFCAFASITLLFFSTCDSAYFILA